MTPKQDGNRELIVTVDVELVPKEGQSVIYQIGRRRMDINVTTPVARQGSPIDIQQQIVLAAGTGLAGALFGWGFPKLMDRLSQRRAQNPTGKRRKK